MNGEDSLSDLHALKKLYGLLNNSGSSYGNAGSENLDEKAKFILKSLLDGATERAIQSQTKMIKEQSPNSSFSYQTIQQCQTPDELGPTISHEKVLDASLCNIGNSSKDLNCEKCGKKRRAYTKEKKDFSHNDDPVHVNDRYHHLHNEASRGSMKEKSLDPAHKRNQRIQTSLSLGESPQFNSSKYQATWATSESGLKHNEKRPAKIVDVIQEEVAQAIQRIEARIPADHQVINSGPIHQKSNFLFGQEDLKNKESFIFRNQLPRHSLSQVKSQNVWKNKSTTMTDTQCGPLCKTVKDIKVSGQIPTKAGSPIPERNDFPFQFSSQARSRINLPSQTRRQTNMEGNDTASPSQVRNQTGKHVHERTEAPFQFSVSPLQISSSKNKHLFSGSVSKMASHKERSIQDYTLPGQILSQAAHEKNEFAAPAWKPSQTTKLAQKEMLKLVLAQKETMVNETTLPSRILSQTVQEKNEAHSRTDSSSHIKTQRHKGARDATFLNRVSSWTGKVINDKKELPLKFSSQRCLGLDSPSQIRTELNKGIRDTTTISGQALSRSRTIVLMQPRKMVKKCRAPSKHVESRKLKRTLARKPSLGAQCRDPSHTLNRPKKALEHQMISMPTLMDQKPKMAPIGNKTHKNSLRTNSRQDKQKMRPSLSSSASSSSWTSQGTTISSSESSGSSSDSNPCRMSSHHWSGPTSRIKSHVSPKTGTRLRQTSVKSIKTVLSHPVVVPPNHVGRTRLTRTKSTEKKVGRLRRLKNKLGVIFHHHHHHHHHHHNGADSSEVGHPTTPNPDHSFWKHLRNIVHRNSKRGVKHPAVKNAPSHHQQGHFHALVEGLLRHVWYSKKLKPYKGDMPRLGKSHDHKKVVKKWHWWQKFHRRGGGVGPVNSGRPRVKVGFRAKRPQSKDKKHFYLG